jgi:hypothetical protein
MFGVCPVREKGSRLCDTRTSLRKFHVKAEAHVVPGGRNFPAHIVGFRAGLMELEISGAHFVRMHMRRESSEDQE